MTSNSPKSFKAFEAKRAELTSILRELKSLGWTVGELPDKMPTVEDMPYLKNLLAYYKETQI